MAKTTKAEPNTLTRDAIDALAAIGRLLPHVENVEVRARMQTRAEYFAAVLYREIQKEAQEA